MLTSLNVYMYLYSKLVVSGKMYTIFNKAVFHHLLTHLNLIIINYYEKLSR